MTRDRLLEQAFELLAIADFHSLTLKEERNQVVREGIELLRQPKPDQNEVQEPVCPECKAVVLYECVACSSNNYPPQPEQEPVAWMLTDKNINLLQVNSIQRLIDRLKHAHHTDVCVRINGQDERFEADWLKHMVRVTPPQRKPLTDEQRKDLMNKAWNKWLGGEDDNHLFAWHFSFEVEAAHGIKGEA